MTFTPLKVIGILAGARMLAFVTNAYHECMGTVAQAIKGDVSSDNPGYYTTAIRGWQATPLDRRHSAAGDMPPGRAFYAATSNIPDGHVAITAGGRRLITTDWPAGRIGIATVEELVDAWGITPLGWTDWFLGHDLIDAPTPPPKEIDTMWIKPTAGGTAFPKPPAARIITDGVHKELVTDPDRIANMDYLAGAAYVVVDKQSWDRTLTLPDYPSATQLSPAQITALAAAVAAKLPKKLTGTLS